MSGENAELVRRFLESYPTSAEGMLDWASEFCAATVDYYPTARLPGARPCHGREELARFHAQFIDAWEVEFEVGRVAQIDDVRVQSQFRLRASGRTSGIVTEGGIHQAAWLRSGEILRLEDHLSEGGARRALGLG